MVFLELKVLDWIAIAVFFLAIFYFQLRVDEETTARPSTHALTLRFRRDWMNVLTTRENRIVDAQILGLLQQSSHFFASGTMIAISGVIVLMSSPDLRMTAELILGHEISHSLWIFKLVLSALTLANGFLKFIWAGRVFGYCAIVMAAIPEDDDAKAKREGARAASLNITAARNFNRGLRLIYFTLASLCWLIGPVAFLLATGFVCYTIWRREFASQSRAALLEE